MLVIPGVWRAAETSYVLGEMVCDSEFDERDVLMPRKKEV